MTFLDVNPDDVPWFSLNGIKTKGRVIKAYDGDSVTLLLEYKHHYVKKKCRLSGIDTPELRSRNQREKKLAYEARDYLRDKTEGKILDVELQKDDKYGRTLVILSLDGININDELIEKGYARKYDGGTKSKWF